MTFDFYGDTQIDRTLTRVIDSAQDFSPAWDEMADKFVASQRRQFSTEGGHASGGWPALSPDYAAWKAKHFPGKGILERTGALKASLTRRPLAIEHITPDEMVIGSDVDYGKYHQRGDGLPRRRPVELTELTRRDMVKVVQKHLFAGVQ